jgi:hypothetical protein
MGEDGMMYAQERQTHQLNNEELAEALAVTRSWLKSTGTGCGDYEPTLAHFKALLAEQLKRAT